MCGIGADYSAEEAAGYSHLSSTQALQGDNTFAVWHDKKVDRIQLVYRVKESWHIALKEMIRLPTLPITCKYLSYAINRPEVGV